MFPPSDDRHLPPGAEDPGVIREFTGAGGRRLRYRVVAGSPGRFHLLYLHGIESHGAWFLPAAQRLARRGCTTCLLDRRGSGLNAQRGQGDAPSAEVLLADVRLFRRQLQEPKVYLAGLSWGGKLAVAVSIDQPEGLEGVVLITPGLRPKVTLPPVSLAAVLVGGLFGGRNRVAVPLRPEMFTRTPRFLEYIRSDPWRTRRVTARFLLASRRLDRMISRRIMELHLPILLLSAGRDEIIDNAAVEAILNGSSSKNLRIRSFPQASHALQFDEVDAVAESIGDFLEEASG